MRAHLTWDHYHVFRSYMRLVVILLKQCIVVIVIASFLVLFLTLMEIDFEYDVCCWLLINTYAFIKRVSSKKFFKKVFFKT